jgi:hypothetical protein
MGHDIYLVGSVPMADEDAVFRTVSTALGPRLKRIPDGETGERGDWITWLETLFATNPAFEDSGETFGVHEQSRKFRRYKLRAGVRPEDVRFGNLLYADIAAKSYKRFKALRDEGVIAPGTRFQVDLVPAHSVLWLFVVDREQAALDPMYNAALAEEAGRIAAAIPHADLAIQYDVASAVFARLERGETSAYGKDKAEMQTHFVAILTRLAEAVPRGVDLLFHFCYGDSNHRHVVEPTDMGDMVEMANRLSAAIKRPIELIHMPVPRDRDDDAYFAPLTQLRMHPETQLCLGLVHYTDGLEGTRRRLATARRHWKDFSIGTECGFGRRAPDTIPALLAIHAHAADDA